MLTQCSTSSSILWQVPLWQTIADHGRVCCAITNLQSRPPLRITHTLRRRCRTLFIRLRPAPTISASRFLRFFLRVRWFLGLVIRLHLSYPTIRVTRAGWRCRSPSLPCVRRRMGLFLWHLLLTQVLLASITITLHQHTPPIIIGVADVAFNSCLRPHMPRYELRALDFVYMHHIILLYSTIHLLARSHYNLLLSAFLDSFNSSTSHVIFPPTIPKKHQVFFVHLYHTPGFDFGLQLCTCNMMQLSCEFSAPVNAGARFRDAGE